MVDVNIHLGVTCVVYRNWTKSGLEYCHPETKQISLHAAAHLCKSVQLFKMNLARQVRVQFESVWL